MLTPARCTSGRINVALVCGGRWHDFDYARLRLLQWLGEHDSVRCAVYSDFSEIEEICAADAVIAYTCDVRPTAVQSIALRDRVSGGGRLLALHATNSAIDAPEPGAERVFTTPDVMPEFSALLGNRFLAHPKIAPFLIEVAQPDHPLVTGIKDFTTTDEIYVSRLASDLEVILDVAFDGPCQGFAEQAAPGQTRHPVLFTRPQGLGTVTTFTLGHCRGRFDIADQGVADLGHVDRVAWESEEFLELMRRCVGWAVHGDDRLNCPVEDAR
jgi:hypothetical protein